MNESVSGSRPHTLCLGLCVWRINLLCSEVTQCELFFVAVDSNAQHVKVVYTASQLRGFEWDIIH